MTLAAKNLMILGDSYKKHSIEQDGVSLLSPPLTPIEPQYSTAIWRHYPRKTRKEFIKSYARMVPYLKPSRELKSNERIFALNVYRDFVMEDNDKEVKSTTTITTTTTTTTTTDCARLNKTVVALSSKRKSMSEKLSATTTTHHPDKKRKRVGSVLPTGKDAAMAFDAIDIDSSDETFYPEGWLPIRDALDNIPVKVFWKGAPLQVDQQPYYHRLHKVEANMASILRLSPIQYLKCKRTLILAARTLSYQQIPFTKSVAQKLCRVDVNKTSALWTAFGQLGWLEAH